MNPNHLHLACDTATALPILREWFDNPTLDIEALAEGNGWTTFDLDCDFLETDEWRRIGATIDLVYESYSTSLRIGELVVVLNSELQRHFLHLDHESAPLVDLGRLAFENDDPIRDWCDVWGFVNDWRWATLS